jgi:hypothetical protein
MRASFNATHFPLYVAKTLANCRSLLFVMFFVVVISPKNQRLIHASRAIFLCPL